MNSQVTSQKLTVLPAAKQSLKTKTKKAKTSTKKSSVGISKRTGLKIGICALVAAIFIGGGFGYVEAFNGKIYPKVTIAGVKIGGLTVKDAREVLNEKAIELNQQGPEITYNGQTLTPTLDEMGVSFNLDETLAQAYQFGRKGNTLDKFKDNFKILTRQYQIPITPQIDEEKFNAYLGQLAEVAEKEPVNASLSVKNGEVVLSPAEKGRGLDKEQLKQDLTRFINSGENGQIVMVTSDLEPTITEEDTTSARAQAEKYMQAASITVTFEDNTWTADKTEVGSWVEFSESGNQLVASVNPNAFINWVAQKAEISPRDREIQDITGDVLDEGQDGRGVDTATLTNQIQDALQNSRTGSTFALVTFAIPRGEKIIYPHAQPGRYAGRYIDINLSEQTLYAFEGNTLMNQFLISSGKRGYATPTGEYSVWGKTRSQLMDGPDYYLPNVPWISWFNGEISIHGTYWHSNFGTPMSHGCINASIPDAEWVYSFVDIGTPVYVHY